MTYTAHNSLNGITIDADNMADALAHVGTHIHVTKEDGFTVSPMDLQNGRCNRATFWATLTGQVRHRIATGRVQGIVAGYIQINR